MINYKKIYALLMFVILCIPLTVNANIICNDGTMSPSCFECHQGCCSHHGGCLKNNNENNNYEKENINETDDDSNLLLIGVIAVVTAVAYSKGKKNCRR